ncbi:hypothetical protein GCM10023262_01140 [Bartonella pachyuromydis]|uniref:Uncharacterized protein n=1 Tax=Bartonella pachyuromydis TaxID=931097 RepID=A0ABP8VB01_9HYPH
MQNEQHKTLSRLGIIAIKLQLFKQQQILYSLMNIQDVFRNKASLLFKKRSISF